MNENNLIDIASFSPDLLQSPSAWLGHLPFAAWIVQEVSPKIFVELGSHYGHSYFAFCQSVVEGNVSTKCYAVDTWLGDAHAGQYSDEIFTGVNAHNEERYAGFSKLLRMTFDDAVRCFADGSVELLHIDGLHTYEAVRHDFETWLPKLAAGAVVLFHDTNVRERGFGVRKLWEELQACYPNNLEFVHSYGLGVLQLNNAPEDRKLDWLQPNSPEKQRLINYFAALGSQHQERFELNQHANNLNQAVAERDGQVANLNQAVAERDGQVANLNQAVAERDGQITSLKLEVEHMLRSRSWRVTRPLRTVRSFVRKIVTIRNNTNELLKAKGGLIKVFRRSAALILSEGPFVFFRRSEKRILGVSDDYQEWIAKYDTLDEEKIKLLKINAEKFKFTPLISIVMPVYNTPVKYLDLAIKSVQNQVYKNWQLCIADDASTNSDVRNLLKQYVEQDDRIKVVFCETNGHISKASNAALALVTGDYIGLLDHDDILREHALYMVVKELNEYPECKFIYSDEDKITEFGVRVDPFFKPDWNLGLFLSVNYLCHFSVFKAGMIKDIGGFREGYEGSQDYDLQLRFTELLKSNEIRHLPHVLYHWRIMPGSTAAGPGEKDYCAESGLRALNDYLSRNNIKANAELVGSTYRVRYALPDVPPLVSLIIPTRNRLELIRQCVDGIHEKTTYPNYEIIVVDNASDDPKVLDYFKLIASEYKVIILKDDRPFNYSQLNNSAVEIAKGEIIGLINNDIEVISGEWLSEMVSHTLRSGVGAVGAKLLYPDDTVQHGGVVLGIGGVAGHSHKHFSKENKGYFGRLDLLSEYSAVTAACLVIKKSIYKQVGGLNEQDLKVAFNDVDFCLRVREAGYINIWTPYAELYHHESMSRGYEDTPEKQVRFEQEVLYMKKKWGTLFDKDPAYSPNLTLEYEDFSYAWPPRTKPVCGIVDFE